MCWYVIKFFVRLSKVYGETDHFMKLRPTHTVYTERRFDMSSRNNSIKIYFVVHNFQMENRYFAKHYCYVLVRCRDLDGGMLKAER